VVLSSISTKNGYPITFKSFTKIGFPIMLMSIAVSTVWLLLRFA
jgi:Na+/H+ antiporter NhaD/arsenite permease-like protein